MRVLDFYTRKRRGDTAIVEWNGEVVALDRDKLEQAVGGGAPIWIESGDLLPSTFKDVPPPPRVEVPPQVLVNARRPRRKG
jgi:hypothetical protein